MFEKCFDRPAAVLLDLVGTRLVSGIGHEKTCRLNSNQTLGAAEGCAVESALELAGGVFGGGGGSSTARSISSVTSREAFLNSVSPLPIPLANSGIRLAPNKTRITTSTNTSSPPLSPNTAKVAFINSPEQHQQWHSCQLQGCRQDLVGKHGWITGRSPPCKRNYP